MNVANFGPIDAEAGVYGACRPGHLGGDLQTWTDILQGGGVSTVICLLSTAEAARWGLPAAYVDAFETHHVPVRDRHLPDVERLERALDLLTAASEDGGGAAIHCNAGLGRTGVVGAAWLVRRRDLAPERAVETIETGPARRSPREAIREGNATEADLYRLLARV